MDEGGGGGVRNLTYKTGDSLLTRSLTNDREMWMD